MITSIMKQSKSIIKTVITATFWLAVWQLISMAVGLDILVPSPITTLLALFDMAKTGGFYLAVLYSLFRIIVGFALGVIFGVLGAVLSVRFSIFKMLTSPILRLIRAVPVASFIILTLVWIKSNNLPIFICFLMVLPIIWDNVESGISSADKKLIEMGKVYGLADNEILSKIKIPLIMPSFISALMTSLGFAWKSGIAAEVICKPLNSLGGMLQDSKVYLETPRVFALTAVVALLSLLLETLIKKAIRRFTYDKFE